MTEPKTKRGRKPRGSTEAERKAAAREYAKEYYRKNHDAIRAKLNRRGENSGDSVKALSATVKKLADDVEKIKWELFGRQK